MNKPSRHSLWLIAAMLMTITVCLSACRPREVLSSRQMRRVLVDLHKTDAVLQANGLQHGHNAQEDACYALVLERHGITQAQFDSSLVWYTNHPQIFDKIYPKVVAELEKEKEEFAAEHAAELAHLLGGTDSDESSRRRQTPLRDLRAVEQTVDSLIWVSLHGAPNSWNEMPMPEPEPNQCIIL